MFTTSTEAYPSDILSKIITPELSQAINQCAPSQFREIDYHHTNTPETYRQARSENVFGNQVNLNSLHYAIELASMRHDIGKILVPADIFPIPLTREQVIQRYHSHPADSLRLLGRKFCQLEDSIPAQITINHHWYGPDYLSEADQQKLGFTITPLNELDDNTLLALTVFVASDRAAALVEDRQYKYNKQEDDKSDDEIIAELREDIKFLNLNQSNPFINPINLPALIEIAQAVSQQNQHILKPTESLHQSF